MMQRRLHVVRTLLLIPLMAIGLMGVGGGGMGIGVAHAADPRFTVSDVAVDVTSDSAEVAKEKALNEGSIRRFNSFCAIWGLRMDPSMGLRLAITI
jgi:hypothetical protein